jgi:hypothetical protein
MLNMIIKCETDIQEDMGRTFVVTVPVCVIRIFYLNKQQKKAPSTIKNRKPIFTINNVSMSPKMRRVKLIVETKYRV